MRVLNLMSLLPNDTSVSDLVLAKTICQKRIESFATSEPYAVNYLTMFYDAVVPFKSRERVHNLYRIYDVADGGVDSIRSTSEFSSASSNINMLFKKYRDKAYHNLGIYRAEKNKDGEDILSGIHNRKLIDPRFLTKMHLITVDDFMSISDMPPEDDKRLFDIIRGGILLVAGGIKEPIAGDDKFYICKEIIIHFGTR